jgi:hypothetical protein
LVLEIERESRWCLRCVGIEMGVRRDGARCRERTAGASIHSRHLISSKLTKC